MQTKSERGYFHTFSHFAASRFAAKVSLLFTAFFLFYSVLPLYAYQDNSIGGSFAAADMAESDDLLTAQDGFLLKPSLITVESDRSQFANTISYEIQKGDTLSKIASQFDLKVKTITDNNPILDPDRLKASMILTILPVDGVLHTIKKGEDISSIAKTYNIKKEVILAQNKLTDGQLAIDQTIIIPGGKKIIPRYIASRDSSATRSASFNGGKQAKVYKGAYTGGVSQSFIKPAAGKITQFYSRGHYALDIGNRSRGPILAAANGVVVKAQSGYNGGYGNMIVIDHGNGRQTLYGHLQVLYVQPGDTVSQGQTIGWMGNTGRVYGATGIHLHFEIHVNGAKVNPTLYIK